MYQMITKKPLLQIVLVLFYSISVFHSFPTLADEPFTIAPCRVLDTRNIGGAVSAGTTFDFEVRGTPGASQGGSAGCGVPTRSTAVILNLVAIIPSSAGHVVLWPYGTTQPTTSVLNTSSGETNNDGLFSPLAEDDDYDLSLKGVGVSANYVIDIVGYTVPSIATLSGQAVGRLDNVLVIDTLEGDTVKVYVDDTNETFYASWQDELDGLIDNCVVLHGLWKDGNSVGEQGLFEARTSALATPTYCGSDQ